MQAVDKLKSAFEAFIQRVMERTRYLGVFPSRVAQQDTDGTVQVTPDNSDLPGMTGVPIRPFAPGVTLKVNQEARALIVFENGSPSKPAVVGWEGTYEQLKELEVQNQNLATLTLKENGDLEARAGGTRITLHSDGGIDINASGTVQVQANGNDIVLNGGNARVSRVGDHTSGHTHTVTHNLAAPSGGGTVTGTINIITATDSMAEGAANVKA
jgi:hypothetical protein